MTVIVVGVKDPDWNYLRFVLKLRLSLDGNYITGRRSVFIILVYWLVMCGRATAAAVASEILIYVYVVWC